MPTLVDTRIAKAIVDIEGLYEGMLILEHGETRDQRDARAAGLVGQSPINHSTISKRPYCAWCSTAAT